MNRLLTSIISAAERRESRDETIAQLEGFGVFPSISLSVPTPENAEAAIREADRYVSNGHSVWVTGDPTRGYCGANNMAASREPLRYALEEGFDILFCEDDIDLAPDFGWFLDRARRVRDAMIYFYNHDHESEKTQGRRYGARTYARLRAAASAGEPFTPKGFYRLNDQRNVNSGQCFYMPHGVLAQLPIHELDSCQSSVDTWVQDRVARAGIPALAALPHPVQHRRVRVGRGPMAKGQHRHARTSMSFDLR